MAKDPVCGMAVDAKKAKKKKLVERKDDKTYYFCSEKCKTAFSKSWIEQHWIEVLLSIFLVVIAGVVFWLGYMLPFMGVVFLILGGLKVIDVKGFAVVFRQYDLFGSRSTYYAYAYPFIELGLGIMYLVQSYVLVAAWVTLVVMSVGAIGVARNMFGKKLRCACLGAKITVPLTGFTLVEDLVMAVMAGMILFL